METHGRDTTAVEVQIANKVDSVADSDHKFVVEAKTEDKTSKAATDIKTDGVVVEAQIADKTDAKVKSAVEAKVGDKTEAKPLKQGDIVTFAGGDIYKSPTAEAAVASCGGGRCKITEPCGS